MEKERKKTARTKATIEMTRKELIMYGFIKPKKS